MTTLGKKLTWPNALAQPREMEAQPCQALVGLAWALHCLRHRTLADEL